MLLTMPSRVGRSTGPPLTAACLHLAQAPFGSWERSASENIASWHWRPETDQESGNLYWYNELTLESSWSPPPLARIFWQVRELGAGAVRVARSGAAAAGPSLNILLVTIGRFLAALWACGLRVLAALAFYARSAARSGWVLALAAVLMLRKRTMDAASASREPLLTATAALREHTIGNAHEFTLDFVERFADPDLRARFVAEKVALARAVQEEERRRINAERWEAAKLAGLLPARPPSSLPPSPSPPLLHLPLSLPPARPV